MKGKPRCQPKKSIAIKSGKYITSLDIWFNLDKKNHRMAIWQKIRSACISAKQARETFKSEKAAFYANNKSAIEQANMGT